MRDARSALLESLAALDVAAVAVKAALAALERAPEDDAELCLKAAAYHAGCSPAAVRRWAIKYKIGTQNPSRRWRISSQKLDLLMQGRPPQDEKFESGERNS
jgi:hypothetical protein